MDFDDYDADGGDNEENQEEGGADQFFEDVVGDAVNPDIISKKDAVIFMIDCQQSIFIQQGEKNQNQFEIILKSIQSFLKAKIISNVDDKVGLILYNINNGNNYLKFKGINIIYPLDSPNAEVIKKLPDLYFNKLYGFANQETLLHEAFWLCNHEFKNLDKNKYTMRIFLFTNDDNPHVNNKNERDLVIHHAKQLAEMDVQIELFPLEKIQGQKFEIRKFYYEILSFDVDELNNAVLDTTSKIMDLQARMRQKEFKKRTLNRIMMQFGNQVQIGIKLYCSFSKAKKPLGKPLDTKTNKPLKKAIKQYCQETGQILYPNQINTYCPIGSEKVKISKEEMEKIKDFETPGLRLLGFKDKSKLKVYHNFRPSYFIYPDEERVHGSSQYFDALIKQMCQKEKIAIARFVPRKGTQIRFCALLPQVEKYDEETHFQTPPGFNLIYLPYADDIRDLKNLQPDNKINLPSKQLQNSAKMLCNCLDLVQFDCRNFEDPALQIFYSHLQAHALGEDQPEKPVDLLQPDEEGIQQYEDTINLFKDALKLESPNEVKKEQPKRAYGQKTIKQNIEITKRSKDQQGKTVLHKQIKKNNIKNEESDQSVGNYDFNDSFIDDNLDEDDFKLNKGRKNKKHENIENQDDDLKDELILIEVEQSLIQGEFKNLKLEDLKQYLKFNKLTTTGKKQDLIDRALNFLTNRNN